MVAASAVLLLALGCASVPEVTCMPGEQPSVADLLYFGTEKPGGTVSAQEWEQFLAASVTPRFPAGLTVWRAAGQWRNADGSIVHEPSFVLSLVHPDDAGSEAAVRQLAAEYKSRFDQQAVLRVKSRACVSL